MRVPYDLKLEAVNLYREHPASTVIEMLGLNVQPRTVQRWAGQSTDAGQPFGHFSAMTRSGRAWWR